MKQFLMHNQKFRQIDGILGAMNFIPWEFSVQWNCSLFSLGMKSNAPKIPSIWRNFWKIMISLIISSISRNFSSAIVYRTLIFGLLHWIFVLYSTPWDNISAAWALGILSTMHINPRDAILMHPSGSWSKIYWVNWQNIIQVVQPNTNLNNLQFMPHKPDMDRCTNEMLL